MRITELNDQRICILGYGREGKAMHKALATHAPDAEVTIRDQQDGEDYLHSIDTFDAIIKSPGVPPHVLPPISNATLTNSMQIFLDSIDQDATVIGITGSKGKSTTSSLIHAILKDAGKDTILVGNIGEPAIAHIDDVSKDTIVVAEMSSFQLQEIERSPQVAVVTSFFPEHLDYHRTLEAYKDAKKNICKYQRTEDTVFFDETSEGARDIASTSASNPIPFTQNDVPVSSNEIQLIGAHNLHNIAAACKVAQHFGIDQHSMVQTIKVFRALPHRLESLGMHGGIEWIDDAISTTPESTMAAIRCFDSRLQTIIVGGKDRGFDFTELGRTIDNSSIKHVIVLGESGERIRESITNEDIAIHEASSMEQAVEIAKQSEGICLLSPASPSYDMYENFEEKGTAFANAIQP